MVKMSEKAPRLDLLQAVRELKGWSRPPRTPRGTNARMRFTAAVAHLLGVSVHTCGSGNRAVPTRPA